MYKSKQSEKTVRNCPFQHNTVCYCSNDYYLTIKTRHLMYINTISLSNVKNVTRVSHYSQRHIYNLNI